MIIYLIRLPWDFNYQIKVASLIYYLLIHKKIPVFHYIPNGKFNLSAVWSLILWSQHQWFFKNQERWFLEYISSVSPRNGQTTEKLCYCFLYGMCAFYAYLVNIFFSKSCRLYYAKIGIGTPAKDYYVQVDTGSDIMWINCIHCKECPKKSSLGVGFSSCFILVTCLIFLCSIPFPHIPLRWIFCIWFLSLLSSDRWNSRYMI